MRRSPGPLRAVSGAPERGPPRRRGRLAALASCAGSIAVLAALGVAAYPLAVEQRWIWKLRELEEAEARTDGAAEEPMENATAGATEGALARGAELYAVVQRLGELRSVRAAQDLLRIAGRRWCPQAPAVAYPKVELDPRSAAFRVLGDLKLPEGSLLRWLERGGPEQCAAAAVLLGEMRSAKALPLLGRLIDTLDPLAPLAAVAMAQIEGALAFDGLRERDGATVATWRFRNPAGYSLWVEGYDLEHPICYVQLGGKPRLLASMIFRSPLWELELAPDVETRFETEVPEGGAPFRAGLLLAPRPATEDPRAPRSEAGWGSFYLWSGEVEPE
ncbi:MAG: hypothetical protein HY721_27955, partial [Planctomycetes bacterium]|nr:hypothetical protein [Planctomycetota bacterium]